MGNLATPEKIRNFQKKLYLKAKNEPGYRFYLLYDKIHRMDILAHAYRRAKANGGVAGVDGVTFEDIERHGVGRFLAELQEELKTHTYRPKPVQRAYVPKLDGGQRPLGIPCIRDRVVQTAALMVLEPIFEADFTDNAYAYRPKRSPHQALKRVHGLLKAGYTDVVDADLSKYFDTIPHAELMRSVSRRISDRHVLALIKRWLQAPVQEIGDDGRRRMTGGKAHHVGTPQGGVVSPFLANIYMRRFLCAWENWRLPTRLNAWVVNYADDFVILCRGTAEMARQKAEDIITGMKLAINRDKTRVVNASEESFDFLGYTFGQCYRPGTRKRYMGAKPSVKRLRRFNAGIREYLHRGNHEPLGDVVDTLNRRLVGWAQYFSYDTVSRAYRAVDYSVRTRFRWWLCRRHKVAGAGTRRFPDERIYGDIGLLSLQKLLAARRSSARDDTSPRAGCGKSARPVR